MIKKTLKNFNLKEIAISGQCFRMQELSAKDKELGTKRGSHSNSACEAYQIIARDRILIASQEGEVVYFDCTKAEFESFWQHYFDLDTDYGKIIASIDSSDIYLRRAAASCEGIRILNQDLWEMIVTFLISQQNNIPRIKKCVEKLCEKYGELIAGSHMHAFPTPSALAGLDEDALMELGFGYRSKYVVRTAWEIESGAFDLSVLKNMNYEDAHKKLLTLYGVGKKVADCVCLFGLHHVEAFPIDTHINKVLDANYKEGFPFDRYEGYAGILQQYMFYYDLHGEEE